MAGKISRVTFNAAVKPLVPIFSYANAEAAYMALSSYLQAFLGCASEAKLDPHISNPIVFRAVIGLFPEVAQRVKDRYGANYTAGHFHEILEPILPRIKQTQFGSPGNSPKILLDDLTKILKRTFTL